MTPNRRISDENFTRAQVSRREALRRFVLVSAAAGATSALLAACGTPTSGPATGSGAGSGASPSADNSAPPPGRAPNTPQGSDVSFAGPSGQLHGSWAAPTGKPKAAVLVIHDKQGLTPHYADLVGRFAGAGYGTLCVDLLSGQSPAMSSNGSSALVSTPADKLLADLRAGISELSRRVPGAKIGAAGFGFGGGLLWQLLAAGEPRLAAVADFYGELSGVPDFSKSHAAVLALYPADDEKLAQAQDTADQAMLNANLVHNSNLYQNSKIGFFDDTTPQYSPTAAAQAWHATLDWFNHNL